MATRHPVSQTAQPKANLCDQCHQKPKFSNHNYCSKTCAAQAASQTASLCNYCHKKPKFQNFDFCGKTCASQAGSTMNQSYTQQAPLGKSNTPNVPSNNQRSNNKGPASSNSRNANTIDPMQIAKLVVQQIPQLQAFLPPQLVQPLMQQQPVYAQPAPQAAPAPVPVASAQTRSVPVNNPFSGSPQPAPAADPFSAAFTSSNPTTFTVQQSSAPVRVDCRIPDCGKPVHVDSQGFSSEYCSMKHREEAVSSGLVSPCIMCLELPQSEADYFCGRACREEALDKQLIRPQED